MCAASHATIAVLTKRSSSYYGWTNLWLAALAMVATLPGRTQGLGLVTEPLIADLGIGRVSYASLNFWATLIGAAFAWPAGRLLDRFGSRRVTVFLAASLGLAVLAMSQLSGWWPLAVSVTLTRGLGQSALSVASLALVGKWFARRLHFAMGIYALLVGIGFIAAFPGVGQAVVAYGWRTAWWGVGMALAAVVAPLAWLLMRDAPAGDALDVEQLAAEPGDLTFGAALATPAFWVFALSSAMFGLVYSGIALFNQSILEQRGFPAATYHQVLVVSTMVGLAANFGGGWLAMRWPLQRLMGVGMAALTLAVALLPCVATPAHVMLYAATMGIAGGIVTVVFFSVWGQVFGRTELGRIQGAAQTLTVVASAIGPLLLAQGLARTGSYDTTFEALAGLIAMLAIAAWIVPLPARRPSHGMPPHPGGDVIQSAA